MESSDFATACMHKRVMRLRSFDRKSMHEMLPSVHQSPSGTFNLSRYSYSDEPLRLNHFEMNHHPIIERHIPPHLGEDQQLRFDSRNCTLHILLHHLRIKTKKIISHDENLSESICI